MQKGFHLVNDFVHCSATTIFTCDKSNNIAAHNWLLKSSKSEVLIYNFETYFCFALKCEDSKGIVGERNQLNQFQTKNVF